MSGKQLTRFVCVLATLVAALNTLTLAKDPVVMGMITVAGPAKINGATAFSGQTLLSGSKIVTEAESRLALNIDGSTRLELEPESAMQVEFSRDTLTGTLQHGTASCATLAGKSIKLELIPSLSVTSDAASSQFTVSVNDGIVELYVHSGVVAANRSNESSLLVRAGERYSNPPNTNPTPNQLSSGKRTALFIIAGGIVAAVFITIVSRSNAPADNFGGCVTTLSPFSPQPPCNP